MSSARGDLQVAEVAATSYRNPTPDETGRWFRAAVERYDGDQLPSLLAVWPAPAAAPGEPSR